MIRIRTAYMLFFIFALAAPQWLVSQSLNFDGVNGSVRVPHNNDLNISESGAWSQGSIMAYIKLNDPTEDEYLRIVSKKIGWDNLYGYELEVNPSQNTITLLAGNDNFARGSFTPTSEWIQIMVTFNENVTVTGTPQLRLETGAVDVLVDKSGASGAVVTFSYTVAADHVSSDLDYHSTSALTLNGGTIQDAVGNNATLTLPEPGTSGSLGYTRSLVIDGIVPTIYSVTSTVTDSVFKIADVIPILVTLSENVTVDTSAGKPQITLETGTTDAAVDYASGSGSSILTFNYTVASGHNSIHLDYASDSALTLNGSTITDAAGSATYLTLAVPGVAGSLAADKTLYIDVSCNLECI